MLMRLFGSLDEASKAIVEVGLEQWHDELLAHGRPTVRYTVDNMRDGAAGIGASRMGGTPDLPPNMDWLLRPPYVDATVRNAEVRDHEAIKLRSLDFRLRNDRARRLIGTDARLPFVAQIDLAKAWRIQKFDVELPKGGRLLFFYDARESPPGFDRADAAGFRVIWDETPISALVRAAAPAELVIDALVFPQKTLCATPGYALPDWETFAYERIGMPLSELEKYGKLRDTYGEAETLSEVEWRGHHYLGGWGDRLSGASADMELECELVSTGVSTGRHYPKDAEDRARSRRADWCLLAQFDCGEVATAGLEHEWFTGRRLYFWIRREDLALRRFESVWVLTR